MYAIIPKGVGKPVGFRMIHSGWPLAEGETFTTTEDPTGKVLAEDEKSLRLKTEVEILHDAKHDKKLQLATKRYTLETGGITVNNAHIQTDRESRSNLIAARTLAKEDDTYSTYWKTADGSFMKLDAETIIAIADAVVEHVEKCFSDEMQLAAQIDAATTLEELRAIEI